MMQRRDERTRAGGGEGSISAIEIGSIAKFSDSGSVAFLLSSVLRLFDNLTSANNVWLDGIL